MTWKTTWKMIVVAFAFALSGCFSTSVKPDLMQRKAGSDFNCSPDHVKVAKVTGNNWTAEGCGKRATYVCSGSNIMTDGTCIREGAIEPAPAT